MAEQISSVSMNTDSICTRPCLAGCLTSAAAAAFGAEPMPASLEYRPRLMPHMMQEPAKPPKMALKSKAPRKIMPKTFPKSPMWVMTTNRETSTYSTPITGTRTSVTLVSRLPPPSTQAPKRTASAAPMITGVVPL